MKLAAAKQFGKQEYQIFEKKFNTYCIIHLAERGNNLGT